MDYNWQPKFGERYHGTDPKFSLQNGDRLRIESAESLILATRASFVTLSGHNTVINAADLESIEICFRTVGETSNNNTIINERMVSSFSPWHSENKPAIYMNGSVNTFENKWNALSDAAGVEMIGTGCRVINTGLIDGDTIGLDFKCSFSFIDNRLVAGPDYSGQIVGKTIGVNIFGNNNDIKFGVGSIIYGVDDRRQPGPNGNGTGVKIDGAHNKDVQLCSIIAGNIGLDWTGYNNFVVSGLSGTSNTKISARIGVFIRGYDQHYTLNGEIEASEYGLTSVNDIKDAQNHIQNNGTIRGYIGVSITGTAKFEGSRGKVIGEYNGIKVNGRQIELSSGYVSSKIGAAVHAIGDKLRLTFGDIRDAKDSVLAVGHDIWVTITGTVEAIETAIKTSEVEHDDNSGAENRVFVSSGAKIAAENAVVMVGLKAGLSNSGELMGRGTTVTMTSNEGNLTNNSDGKILSSKSAAILSGASITLTNKGTFKGGKYTVQMAGPEAKLYNYGEIASDSIAVRMENEKSRFFNYEKGVVTGLVEITGFAATVQNNGTLIGRETALRVAAKNIADQITKITSTNKIEATGDAVILGGYRASFSANGEKGTQALTASGTRSAIRVEDGYLINIQLGENSLTSGKVGQVALESAAVWTAGEVITVEANGKIDSPYGLFMSGLMARFRIGGSISFSGSKSDMGTGVHISSNRFDGEISGSVKGKIAMAISGELGRLVSTSNDALLEGTEAGLALAISKCKEINFQGTITSEESYGATLNGNTNKASFRNISSQKKTAFFQSGENNETTLTGTVTGAVYDVDVQNKAGGSFTISETARLGTEDNTDRVSFFGSGDLTEYTNRGHIFGRMVIENVIAKIKNYFVIKGVDLKSEGVTIENHENGRISSTKTALLMTGVNVGGILNNGHIESSSQESIRVALGELKDEKDFFTIHNGTTGVIGAAVMGKPQDAKAAIHITSPILFKTDLMTVITNEGRIYGTVELSDQMDEFKNTGIIKGNINRSLDGVNHLVSVFLGDGMDNSFSSSSGHIDGEIWGGSGHDVVILQLDGSHTVRSFDGKDSVFVKEASMVSAGDDDDNIAAERDSYLKGEDGDDLLISFDGNNTLEGGEDCDSFLLAHKPDESKVDHIVEFDCENETIHLNLTDHENAGTAGSNLNPQAFAILGKDIITPLTRVIYNQLTGDAYYDPDGNTPGGKDAIKFIHFDMGTDLTSAQFHIDSEPPPRPKANKLDFKAIRLGFESDLSQSGFTETESHDLRDEVMPERIVFSQMRQVSAKRPAIVDDFDRSEGQIIDLHLLDANKHKKGNQAFHFIGSKKFHHKAGELRFEKGKFGTHIAGDVNGDGKVDLDIYLRKFKGRMFAEDFAL